MASFNLVSVVGSGSTTVTKKISQFKENSFPKIIFILIQKILFSSGRKKGDFILTEKIFKTA